MAETIEELISAAARAHSEGRWDDAEQLARQVLALEPLDVQALLLLGVISVKRGCFGEAAGYLERVSEGDPSSMQGPLWLSVALRGLGRPAEALLVAERATSLNPRFPMCLNQLAGCLLDLGRFSEAEVWFRRALSMSPQAAPVYDGLGQALQGLGRHSEALVAYRKACELDPRSSLFLLRLGEASMSGSDPREAARCARRVLELGSGSAQAHLLLARALLEENHGSEALEHASAAQDLGADPALCAMTTGHILRGLGRMDEAVAQFSLALDLKPDLAQAYLALVQSRRVESSDSALVGRMEGLADGQSADLHYGLGKSYEDLGEFEKAMAEFDEANRISRVQKFGSRVYNPAEHAAGFDQIIRTFSPQLFSSVSGAGMGSQLLVFVLGMMRSGTTLVEQILSSHASVGAAGEQRFWPDHRGEAVDLRTGQVHNARLQTLAGLYVQSLQEAWPGALRVVDKMPVNYTTLGLLYLAFPEARFIHTIRNPADTCISIWTTPNRSRIEWSHDKASLVFAYRQYERLMEHWRTVIPADRLLEVRYEELVTDREKVTREMVSFCGLDWDDACLRPESNVRAVSTPSVWQVRQPVYTSSMERWRKFEPWLGAFRELLVVFLLLSVVAAYGQPRLSLPARRADALAGSVFASQIGGLPQQEREERIWREVTAGNVPDFLRQLVSVPVSSGGVTGRIFVAPDYLAVGSNEDYFYVPLTPFTAQRIADRVGCTLPTPLMVDAIYQAATVKLAPSPINPSPAMTTIPVFLDHNRTVWAQRSAVLGAFPLGALVAGDKKDLVICKGLPANPRHVAIYGWHRLDGHAIQPLYLGHFAYWADYSHGTRLVSRTMEVSGRLVGVEKVLADPSLCSLISGEGPLSVSRYRFSVFPHPDDPTIHVQADERLESFSPMSGVRVVIDEPAALQRKVRLVLYALPNGNTIEQTFGRRLRPDDDWHYDIQHIGAQMRFVRRLYPDESVVVAYLEAANHAWPAWLRTQDPSVTGQIVDAVAGRFAGHDVRIALDSHSGGGAFVFSYLKSVDPIPSSIDRIAFLDSEYDYDPALHEKKLASWVEADGHFLCVIAYDDASARYEGKPFVSAEGGTWGRSHAMLADLGREFAVSRTNSGDPERYEGLSGRVVFWLKENPKAQIFHTVQVERNGFVESLLSGTPHDGQGYRYFGRRAYSGFVGQ